MTLHDSRAHKRVSHRKDLGAAKNGGLKSKKRNNQHTHRVSGRKH